MNDLNIYDDSRNRGLEVLLYQPEKISEVTENEQRKFKFKFRFPLFFNREFYLQFESFINIKPKLSEKE